RRCALGQLHRCDRQEPRSNGQSDEGIVTISLEGKWSDDGQTEQDSTDTGQYLKPPHFVGGAHQSTGLTSKSFRHRRHALICGAPWRRARLAAENPPPRKRVERPASSSCSQRNVWMSSTSYHSASSVVTSPISAARSQVARATVSVPHAICVNRCRCGRFKPMR